MADTPNLTSIDNLPVADTSEEMKEYIRSTLARLEENESRIIGVALVVVTEDKIFDCWKYDARPFSLLGCIEMVRHSLADELSNLE